MYKHMIIRKEKELNELLVESVCLPMCLSVSGCLPNDIGHYKLFTSSSLPSLLFSILLLSFPLRGHTQTHTRIPHLYLITPLFQFRYILHLYFPFFLTFFPFPFPPPSLSFSLYVYLSLSL